MNHTFSRSFSLKILLTGITAAVIPVIRLSAATVEWNTDASGTWNTASNWTSNPSLPGATDDVIIDRPSASVTVTHSGSSNSDVINSLICNESLVLSGGTLSVLNASQLNGLFTLSGGTISANGEVNVTTSMLWTGGTIAGSRGITIVDGANLLIQGTNTKYMNDAMLSNYGSVAITGSGTLSGQSSNVTINNMAGGIIDCQSIPIISGPSFVFNNAGTFRKSVSTGTTIMSVVFNNTGTVEVNTGTLRYDINSTCSGLYKISSDATLQYYFGTYVFSNAAFNNSGTILLTNSTCIFDTPTPLTGIVKSESAIISGTGCIVPSNESLTLQLNVSLKINNGSLINSGVINMVGYGVLYGTDSNTNIDNLNGGIFDCQGSTSIAVYSPSSSLPVFNNAGTFRKTTNTANCNVNWTFNNSGTVDVQTGMLSLTGGGTHSGLFKTCTDSTLSFSTGPHLFIGTIFNNAGIINYGKGAYTFTNTKYDNTGIINYNGGLCDYTSSTIISGVVILSSGQITCMSQIIFNNIFWTGGYISGSTGVEISSDGTMQISGDNSKIFKGGILKNSGTIIWTELGYIVGEGTNYPPTIMNMSKSLFDCQTDSYIIKSYGSGHTFHNAGTFRKSAGSSVSGIEWTFHNSGTVEVQTGILILSGGGDNSGTYNISTNAVLQFNGGSHYFEGSAFTNNGIMRFTNGETNFLECSGLTGQFQIDGGEVNLNTVPMNGNLTMSTGSLTGIGQVKLASLAWSGGTMSGFGITQINGTATIRRANTLEARNFINNGTTDITGSAIVYGKDAATFANSSGKLVDLQGDGDYYYWSGQNSALNNAGTLRKSTGTGTSIIEWIFNNTGKLDVQSGTVELRRGGTGNGEFDIASGASLIFNGGTHNLDGGKIVNEGTLLFINDVQILGHVDINNSGTINAQAIGDLKLECGIIGSGTTIVSGHGVTLNITSIKQNALIISSGVPSAVPEPASLVMILIFTLACMMYWGQVNRKES